MIGAGDPGPAVPGRATEGLLRVLDVLDRDEQGLGRVGLQAVDNGRPAHHSGDEDGAPRPGLGVEMGFACAFDGFVHADLQVCRGLAIPVSITSRRRFTSALKSAGAVSATRAANESGFAAAWSTLTWSAPILRLADTL